MPNKSICSREAGTKLLVSLLEKASLPYVTSAEQIQLAVIVDCMSEVSHIPPKQSN
jgi:hypothetical protein